MIVPSSGAAMERRNPGDLAEARDRSGVFACECSRQEVRSADNA